MKVSTPEAAPPEAAPRTGPQLTPLQERTLSLLRRGPEPVMIHPEAVSALIEEFTMAVDDLGTRLPEGSDVFMSKHLLSRIHGCETAAVHPEEFAWSVPVAVGQIAHRAIQIGVHWTGEPVPLTLVDEALARISDEDTTLGDWVAGLTVADRAELRGLAGEKVTKFMECFPPLDPRAHPMTEARVQWPLNGPIILAGKVDLVMGRPAGAESRKLIVDFKTGRPRPAHREDLRYYALLETLRARVPPRKVASFYLDAGDTEAEDVTLGVLGAAARRTLDGLTAYVEITTGTRAPTLRPSFGCTWCALRTTCTEGQAFLASLTEDDEGDPDALPDSLDDN